MSAGARDVCRIGSNLSKQITLMMEKISGMFLSFYIHGNQAGATMDWSVGAAMSWSQMPRSPKGQDRRGPGTAIDWSRRALNPNSLSLLSPSCHIAKNGGVGVVANVPGGVTCSKKGHFHTI